MSKQKKDHMQRYGKKQYNKMRKNSKKIKVVIKAITVVTFLFTIYFIIKVGMLWKKAGNTNIVTSKVEWLEQNNLLQQKAHKIEIFNTKDDKEVDTSQIKESGSSNEDKYTNEIEQNGNDKSEISKIEMTPTMLKIKDFANKHHISINEYPTELIELLGKNQETEEFVLNYPFEKETYSKKALSEYLDQEEIPLFMQWDKRWGYYAYGSSIIGITGCGPTCLSMVAIHLLQNPAFTPIYMADYAQENGYYVQGTGTSWEFMSRGASELGLRVKELPLDENRIKEHLENANPIICIMGKGDFTDKGHFIVLTGIENGKIKVNDPNSKENSEKLWEFEQIKYQIKNLWVYFK